MLTPQLCVWLSLFFAATGAYQQDHPRDIYVVQYVGPESSTEHLNETDSSAIMSADDTISKLFTEHGVVPDVIDKAPAALCHVCYIVR